MIKLKNITKHFQSFSIQSLNYTFENKLYKLQGDNGSGKSVLLKIIAGLDRNIKGEVVNTKKKYPILFLTDTGIGLPYVTINDNIKISAKILGVDCPKNITNFFSSKEQLRTAYHLASVGMQHKVGLSLLFSETDYGLIVLDEALNGIDSRSSELIVEQLNFLTTKHSCPILFVSHYLDLPNATKINIKDFLEVNK